MQPPRTVAEQDADLMPRLHERDPDLCCWLRKVEPLAARWRRTRPGARASAATSRRPGATPRWSTGTRAARMVKVNPLAAWTQDDVDAYIDEHEVPVNPLFEDGYASIGCAPCTRPVAPGEDPRSGRWAGQDEDRVRHPRVSSG